MTRMICCPAAATLALLALAIHQLVMGIPSWASEAAVPGQFQPSTGSVVVDGENASWTRGVPHGGIGTFGFEILPSGRFVRLALHNTPDLPVPYANGTFLAVSAKVASGGGTARILQVPDAAHPLPIKGLRGMQAVAHRSLFPFSEWAFTEPSFPLEVRLISWSPLFPGELTESCLPLAVLEVSLVNTGGRPVAASVALSWEDLTGRGGSLLPNDQHEQPLGLVPNRILITTAGLRGIILSPGAPMTGRQSTFAGDVFVGTVDRSGMISTHMGWQPTAGTPGWWNTFEHRGRVDTLATAPRQPRASQSGRGRNRVSATVLAPEAEGTENFNASTAVVVASRVHVAPGETRTIPFVVAWHMPVIQGVVSGVPPVRTAHAARFGSIIDLLNYAGPRLVRIKAGAQQWQSLVLHSTLPLESRILQLQAASKLISHGVYGAGERFSMLEVPGRGRGMLGGIEFRGPNQAMMLGLYPELDRDELLGFAAAQKTDGRIPRHLGNLHGGFTDLEAEFVGDGSGEATAAFLIQAATHYRATGDEEFRRAILPVAKRALTYLDSQPARTWKPALGDALDPTGRLATRELMAATARLAALDLAAGANNPRLEPDPAPQSESAKGADGTDHGPSSGGALGTSAPTSAGLVVPQAIALTAARTTATASNPEAPSSNSATIAPSVSTSPTNMVADKQTSPTKTLLTANTETVSTPGSARKAADNPGVDLLGPGDFPGPNRSAWMLESVALASIGALPPALDIHAASAAMARLESWRGSPGEFWLRPVSPVSNSTRLSPAIATTALASTAMRLGHHALGWEIVRQAQASATGRPTGLWAMALFEDRATGVPAMASTAAQSYFAGHRGADVWWGLPADLAGFAIDVPRGILYLNPPADRTGAPPPVLAPTATATPDYSTANQSTTASPPSSAGPMTDPTRPATMSAPSSVNGVVAVDALDSTSSPAVSGLPAGQTLDSTASLTTFTPPVPAGPPLELPLMTPRAWLWLEWDAVASSGTLTVLRVPPSGRSGGAPVLIKTVATGRNPDGTLRGQLDLTEPIDLGPGRVFVLSRRPESSNDEGLGHAADTLHAPGPWISLRRVR